jgi:hypothetical protein
MAPPPAGPESAKAAHVNMMTDTIIANLPPDGLRSVLRSLLGVDHKVTPAFQLLAAKYLESTKSTSIPALFDTNNHSPNENLQDFQGRYRCLMGCGNVFASLQAIGEVIKQVRKFDVASPLLEIDGIERILAIVDSDLVQAVTALQKTFSTSSGPRTLTAEEQNIMQDLQSAILNCNTHFHALGLAYFFQRGGSALETVLGKDRRPEKQHLGEVSLRYQYRPLSSRMQTTKLGDAVVPRMFMGLWQFSSPAWGSASFDSIQRGFRKHVDGGFVAYGMWSRKAGKCLLNVLDMADHYGDAERTFVSQNQFPSI